MTKGREAMTTAAEAPEHHGSHRNLLWALDDPPPPSSAVDAIIVPTARPPAHLTRAAHLARSLDCPLVTLHSGRWTSAREAAERLAAGVDLMAIDIPEPARLRLPELETSGQLTGTIFARRSDLSPKRNIALVLSRMLDWSRVIFIDDDITDLDPGDMRRAAGLLDTHCAVGLTIEGFPDNSVVCHAFRDAGGEQQAFIGGGALAVEVGRNHSFFPDVYNDDWFYLLEPKTGLQPVATAGRVTQQPYDPFRNPDRARAEEFGDVLAEGIYWLLDQGRAVADADLGHWAGYLGTRKRFVTRVLRLVADQPLDAAEKARRIAALKGALGRLALITPARCHEYLRAWTADRDSWQRHIQQTPTGLTRARALDSLSRRGTAPLTWHASDALGLGSRRPVSAR